MNKIIFVGIAVCTLLISACKRERVCNCESTYTYALDYTGTLTSGTANNYTKDTSYTYTAGSTTKSFTGASKGKISSNGQCNSTTQTDEYILHAPSASATNVIGTDYTVPAGHVKVGTRKVEWKTDCTLDKE